MSSLWWIQNAGSEQNHEANEPLTFEQLAQRLADGTLSETDLIRSETADHWQAADSVIGLSRAAEKLRLQRYEEPGDEAGSGPSAIAPAGSESSRDQRIDATTGAKLRTDLVQAGTSKADLRTGDRHTGIRPPALIGILIICAVVAGLAWFGWSQWFEGQRFPRPAHLAPQSQPLSLPWIGPVSHFEIALLMFDAVALAAFAVWWFRSKRAG